MKVSSLRAVHSIRSLFAQIPNASIRDGALLFVFVLVAVTPLLPYSTLPAATGVFVSLTVALIALTAALYAVKNNQATKGIEIPFVLAAVVFVFLCIQLFRSGFANSSLFGFGFSTGTFISWATIVIGVLGGAILFSTEQLRMRLLHTTVLGAGVFALLNVALSSFNAPFFTSHSHATFSNFVLLGIGLVGTTMLLVTTGKLSKVAFGILSVSQLLFFTHIFLSKSAELMFTTGLGVVLVLVLALHVRSSFPALLKATNILSLFFGVALVAAAFTTPSASHVAHTLVGTPNQEIRPSTLATVRVGISEVKEHPAYLITGSGLHSFSSVWNTHMPQEVRGTKFWNEDFATGSNLFLTTLIELGGPFIFLLGILIVLALAVLLTALLRKTIVDIGAVALAAIVVFVGVWSVLYTPSPLLLAVGAVCGGALCRSAHKERVHTFLQKCTRVCSVVLLFGSLLVIVFSLFHIAALHVYGLGVNQLQKDPPEYANAATRFEQSLSFAELPETLRSAALAFTGRSQAELEQQVTEGSLGRAIEHARSAATLADRARMKDLANYRTHVILGETLLLRGILEEDVALIASAIESFDNALVRAPQRLVATFGKARALASLDQREEKARELVLEVLEHQPSYKPAEELLKTLDN